MSAAYAKGVAQALPEAQISYDRFHVIAMANEAMDGVRRQEMSTQPQAVKEVVRGMLDNRSNAYVEAMNGLLQQAKRAARGLRTASHFIAIAYLRMSKLKHLPSNPLLPAMTRGSVITHRCL